MVTTAPPCPTTFSVYVAISAITTIALHPDSSAITVPPVSLTHDASLVDCRVNKLT